MKKAKIFMHNDWAGTLIENVEGYHFRYEDEYLKKKNPNPSNGTFELNIKEQHKIITIRIFSADRKLVVEKQLSDTQNSIEIVTDLSSGVYNLSIPELDASSKLIIK